MIVDGGVASPTRTGGLAPRGESFVTQDLPYVEQLAARYPEKYETTVKFDMQEGTRDALIERGAQSNNAQRFDPSLPDLPAITKGQTDLHVKAEKEAITFGLRRNPVSIFNDRIRSFEELE